MRITGAGDITKDLSETLEHKLPQSRISKGAAHGYSSYGNQIGLATTYVKEIFDDGYVAKPNGSRSPLSVRRRKRMSNGKNRLPETLSY